MNLNTDLHAPIYITTPRILLYGSIPFHSPPTQQKNALVFQIRTQGVTSTPRLTNKHIARVLAHTQPHTLDLARPRPISRPPAQPIHNPHRSITHKRRTQTSKSTQRYPLFPPATK
ncbi:hypothetical protein BDV95DRAFT_104237 [Massariosphaeria phaeospora]|uniref:Uncharacterized protein n=1 Tax=Massariosphaeria phaeospora TaxID=100035 RepID=A0A7C8I326_9PLEO|nr:hypothetical protein BDV95DRAFT_104237 [Massariosphaeria phaeospora]